MEKETWKPIKGYEGFYEVSNYGRVRSVEHVITRKDGVLHPIRSRYIYVTTLPRGYKKVMLYKDGKAKGVTIHRLVAETFIPNPDNLETVNHKDENKANNHVSNLEWCTRDYNCHYGGAIKRMRETQIMNALGKRPVLQFSLEGKFIKEFFSIGIASRELGIKGSNIIQCCSGHESYAHAGGYQWKYKDSNKVITNILPIIQTDLDGNEIKRYGSVKEAARETGFSTHTIWACIRGERVSHCGYIWKKSGYLKLRKDHP